MSHNQLNQQQFEDFHRDGYLIAPSFFSGEEIEALNRRAHADRALDQHAIKRDDGEGGSARLALWNHPGDDLYGMFSRCEDLVDSVEFLLEDEPYHYHSKMIMKDPGGGGAWAWHQDYGYWYQNGLLYPDLLSVMIAVDPANKKNGCLQVIRGSHKMGRIDHVLTGEQAGADQKRVEDTLTRMELVYCEMQPGDAVFFHSNTLHRSDRNDSDKPRWSLICCYNTKHNNPLFESHHPSYTPIHKTPRSAIMAVAAQSEQSDDSGGAWLDPAMDYSATSLKEIEAARSG